MKVASALTLVATLVALIAPARAAEQRDGLHAGASLDRDAELMQRCLEPQMAPWQIESTSSTDGKTTDSVRLTRWGDMPESRCLARLGRSAEACALPHGLQRVVRLEFVAGEPHPAWSANDRARLEDLIPSTLQQPAGDIRIKPAPSSGPDPSGEILRVRLAYLGMPTLQRTLAEWVRGPRGLVVTMTLVDPAGGDRVMASRELTFRQGPQWSDPQASTSSARWMRDLVGTVDSTAKAMIAPLACSAPSLAVRTERGRIWLSLGSFTGLQEGRPMLLVPTADPAVASRWPIARVLGSNQGGRMELEILRGSPALCDAGCRAVPL